MPYLFFFLLLASTSFAQSVQLLSSEFEACDFTKDATSLKTRISSLSSQGDTTFLTIAFSAGCCQTFEGSLEQRGDTLNFAYVEIGQEPECFCWCCYGLAYQILGYQEEHILLFRNQPIVLTDQEYIQDTVEREQLAEDIFIIRHKRDGVVELERLHFPEKVILRKYHNGRLVHENVRRRTKR